MGKSSAFYTGGFGIGFAGLVYEKILKEKVEVMAGNRSLCDLCGFASENEHCGLEFCANGFDESYDFRRRLRVFKSPLV